MRTLHTSDWHIGRTFHGHSTTEHLATVLTALVEIVRDREVDVVVVAGDIFDSAMPSAECFTVLSTALRGIREAGAEVVITSGNHDSATRLGFQSEWLGVARIHIRTEADKYAVPILIDDEYGPVAFYGIPYLEPSMFRHQRPGAGLRTHEQVLQHAMNDIRADAAARAVSDGFTRSVVLSHSFVVNVGQGAAARTAPSATDVERDITSGGLDIVPASVFDGPDYVALGHLHGRSTLTERVRYSGAPLHYSFSEADKPRGVWLVELDAAGLDADSTEWIDLPVPRALTVLTGTIDELVGDERFAFAENNWVSAILTDRVRPMDAMRRLQDRFPWCATLEHRPADVAPTDDLTYRQRVDNKTDAQIVAGFLELVRGGVGPSEFESTLIAEVAAAGAVREATA